MMPFRKPLRPLLLPVTFLSGFTALLYQVVWIKKFGHLFGLQVVSMSIVLASFMLGLALGSYFVGKLSDRYNRFGVYLVIEIGLALFALFFQPLFDLLVWLYTTLARGAAEQVVFVQGLRLFLSLLFLLIPSVLIGGTLPVVVRIAVESLRTAGRKISIVYALNNLGAFAGAFVTGFFLIRFVGIGTTLLIGAAINILTALLVLLISRFQGSDLPVQPEREALPAGYRVGKALLRTVLVVFLLEGFTTLAYEVLWTRIFVEFSYDKTTYLYTVIIMAYIFGLALGSMLISRRIDRIANPVGFLGKVQLAIATLSVMQLLLVIHFLPALMAGRDPGSTWLLLAGREYLFIFLFLLLPAVLMGMTFPVVSRVMAVSMDDLGGRIGLVGLLDTLGSVVGSLMAGLLLIPLLGVVRSLFLVAAVNLVGGLLLYRSERRLLKLPVVALVAIPLFVAALLFTPSSGAFKSKLGKRPMEQLIHFEEAACGTVTVHAYPMGYQALSINSVLFAYNTEDDLRSHSMLAYMPYLFHPEPKNALVLGFGLGITASCFDQPGIDSIFVAEICPAVIRASTRHFSAANNNVFHNEKVTIIPDDGRSWMELTARKYDLITCDAIHPRYGNNLYTREYYELCRDHLNESGVVCQWMPLNWLSEQEYKSLLATFVSVFPHATLWYVNRGVTLAVGTKSGQLIDWELLRRRTRQSSMTRNLRDSGIRFGEELPGYYLMKDEAIGAFAGDVEVNSDDHPHVEYSTVVSMAPNAAIVEQILHLRPDPLEILTGTPDSIALSVMLETRRQIENQLTIDLSSIRAGAPQ